MSAFRASLHRSSVSRNAASWPASGNRRTCTTISPSTASRRVRLLRWTPDSDIHRGRDLVYNLHAHLVFVTRYRRDALNDAMLTRCRQSWLTCATKLGAQLRESNGDPALKGPGFLAKATLQARAGDPCSW